MSLEITGKIEKFLDVEKGTSKDGKEWQKQSYLVETTEQYNNLCCLEVFGTEQVEKLTKYNKVGDNVKVQFNVKTNEWKGKYYTSLQSWRIEKVENLEIPKPHFEEVGEDLNEKEPDDLPF